jgi:hypothetical protein
VVAERPGSTDPGKERVPPLQPPREAKRRSVQSGNRAEKALREGLLWGNIGDSRVLWAGVDLSLRG